MQTLVYDNFNRVTSSTWNDGVTPAVTTKYDAASRVTGITNTNSAITRAYYNDGLLNTDTSKYADGISRTVTYTYDPDGRRGSLTYPNSAYVFNYTYTGRGQLDLLQASGSTIVSHGYDLNGNLTSRAPNNSTSTAYGYDWMNRCNSITHFLNGTTRTLTYQYDSVGNRQWVKRDGSLGDAYGYDLADQVNATQLNIANPDTSGPGSTDIVYDANGNRTSFAANDPTDTYAAANSLNQYTSRTSGGTTTSAVYDASGNMTTGLDGSTYTYDAQNRVLSAATAGTSDTFLYDGLNRQIGKKIGSGSMYYRVYDGWDLLGEYLKGSANAYWAYLYGAGGIVKNLVTNNYYYQDASGSTTHLANSSGTLIEAYRYDLQGTPVFLTPTGTLKTNTSYGVRHLFTGQQWYNELKLYDLRNRYYLPDIGRFLQGDPIGFKGDATNLYRYCGNNPLTRSDPAGKDAGSSLPGTQANGGWGDDPTEGEYTRAGAATSINNVYIWPLNGIIRVVTPIVQQIVLPGFPQGNIPVIPYITGQGPLEIPDWSGWPKGAYPSGSEDGGEDDGGAVGRPYNGPDIRDNPNGVLNTCYLTLLDAPNSDVQSTSSLSPTQVDSRINTTTPQEVGGVFYPFGYGNNSPTSNWAGGTAGTIGGAFTWSPTDSTNTPTMTNPGGGWQPNISDPECGDFGFMAHLYGMKGAAGGSTDWFSARKPQFK
ncbi:MAG: RHS repeat protein [Verrucomicrobia bacterium]|nr:RHS repeat protein [Verrucomicrobiota bacterium]